MKGYTLVNSRESYDFGKASRGLHLPLLLFSHVASIRSTLEMTLMIYSQSEMLYNLRLRDLVSYGCEVGVARIGETRLSLAEKVVTEDESNNPSHFLGLLSFPEIVLTQSACEKDR